TAPPRSSPRARAASSAGPPTAASWPSSIPASPGPATAGTSSTPCPPCAAPRTAPRPSPSSASSPPDRPSARGGATRAGLLEGEQVGRDVAGVVLVDVEVGHGGPRLDVLGVLDPADELVGPVRQGPGDERPPAPRGERRGDLR